MLGSERWATHRVLGKTWLTKVGVANALSAYENAQITVASGGMYTQKLDITDLNGKKPYDGTVAYAQHKVNAAGNFICHLC